jgi:EAL domain-containing protein (putative c-di-GMP-specific phosphodiesterase class I)
VRAIVHGIQNTATELGLITLAEHVETEAQAEILRRIGINWAQGHHYGAAALDQEEADVRRQMSVNWARGYYYQKDQ